MYIILTELVTVTMVVVADEDPLPVDCTAAGADVTL
jgi:hypothetical protein